MHRLLILLVFIIFCSSSLFAQDYFSYGNSNYGGVSQVLANPAAANNTKLKLDILLGGFDASFNNSWAAVKREAISFPKLPGSWRNYTPNLPDNIYKNFDWQPTIDSRDVVFEQRVLLPSVLFKVDEKNSFAFTCSMRQIGNISGITTQLANLFEKEFDLSVLQNNPVQSKNFSAIRMSWIEYGITYARMLLDKDAHRFTAGITPKILQGLESSYFILRDLNFLFSNKDTLSYFDADFSVAHSSRTGSVLDILASPAGKLQHSAPLKMGVDLGVFYEWHPRTHISGKDAPAEKSNGVPSALYKLKAGVSLVDVGKIKFYKEPDYYDLQLSIHQSDIIKYISAQNVRVIDSLLQKDFPANTGENNFDVLLPTALNTQLDFSFTKNIFLNLSSHITGFYKSNFYKVKNYSAVCLSPRFESYWVDFSLMITWNSLSFKRGDAFTPGANIRLGPITLGSSDLSFMYKKNLSSLNFYTMLRIPIVSKKHDQPVTGSVQ